jgi:hypothetical protein
VSLPLELARAELTRAELTRAVGLDVRLVVFAGLSLCIELTWAELTWAELPRPVGLDVLLVRADLVVRHFEFLLSGVNSLSNKTGERPVIFPAAVPFDKTPSLDHGA